MRQFRRVGAEMAVKLARQGLAQQRNAEGRAWAPAKDGQALTWMKGVQVSMDARGDSVAIRVAGPSYTAPDHSGASRVSVGGQRRQKGRRFSRSFVSYVAKAGGSVKRWKIPARRILPKRVIPKRWGDPILREMGVTWKQVMGKGRLSKKK